MAQNLFDSTFHYGERQGDFSELLQIFSCKSFIGFCPNISYKLWVVCIQIYIHNRTIYSMTYIYKAQRYNTVHTTIVIEDIVMT